MRKILLILLPLLMISSLTFGQFTINKGQIHDESGRYRPGVQFVTDFPGGKLFFTKHGLVYYYKDVQPSKYMKIKSGKIPNPYSEEEWTKIQSEFQDGKSDRDFFKSKAKGYRIDIAFPGADLTHVVGQNKSKRKNSYYFPGDKGGVKDVANYKKIRYSNIYPGVDLVFYHKKGKLKYDFVVAPNADARQIKILYKGQKRIKINQNGEAVVDVLPGKIIENAPISFQNDQRVKTSFYKNGDTLLFKLDRYNHNLPLTIDPSLDWSTYFHDNSTSNNSFSQCRPVWDANGGMFITYSTYNNTNFPLINPGGSSYYQITTGSTGLQTVIMKFDNSKNIVWATYYASSQSCHPVYSNQAITIDRNGNIYIIGEMSFPYGSPTPSFPFYDKGGSAYYETYKGNSRSFVLEFSNNGTRLWATGLDVSSSDVINVSGVDVDSQNRLYITGSANGNSSVVGATAIPTADPGGSHYYKATAVENSAPILLRFSTAGALQWGTFISQGQPNTYNGFGDNSRITLDDNDNVIIATTSSSPNYTLVNPGGGAYQDNDGSAKKISVFKFTTNGALYWNTLYGGYNGANSTVWQYVGDVGTLSNGDIVIVGETNRTDFPTHNPGGGAYMKTSFSTGDQYVTDGVIIQFSGSGVLKWATLIGGNGTSDGSQLFGFATNTNDDIIVGGFSRTKNTFPIMNKSGSYNQATNSQDYALTLSQFDKHGVMKWSTYFGNQTLGGGGAEAGGFGGRDVADLNGCYSGVYAFVAIESTEGTNTLPTVDYGGYYESSPEGTRCDFISEFVENGIVTDNNTTSTSSICESDTKTLTSSGAGNGTWSVISGGGSISGTTYTPGNISTSTNVTIQYTDLCGNTSNKSFQVNPSPTITTGADKTICSGESVSLSASGASSYSWNHSAGTSATPSVSPTSTTTYTVTGTTSGCSSTATQKVTVKTTPTVVASANKTICSGESVTISASGASSYSWNHSVGSGSSHWVSPSGTITYTVTGTTSGCSATDDVTITVKTTPTITTGADKTICSGESVSLSASGASSYSWNHSAGTGATPSVSPTTTTTYTVTGTTSGCSNTATQKVTVKTTPTVVASADQSICSGESVTISANGASSYSWNHSVGSGSSHSVSPSGTITYTVTGTTSGCSATDDVTITVTPTPTITTGADKTICSGESVSLSASGASSYSWNHSAGTGATPSVSPTTTTTYTVTGTTGGCSNTATQKVTVNTTPTVVASTDQTICAGESVTISASGANTYSWNHSVGSGSSHSVSPSATTTYTVTGTSNSCSGTDDVTVTVNPLPTFTITDSVNPTACGNSDGTITLSGLQNNTSYSVSYNGNSSTSMTTNGSGEITITGLPAGSYANFTVALNGCSTSDHTTTVNLQDPNAPTVNAGTDQTICSGDSITLTASNPDGATITWNNGVTDGQTFVPTVGNTDTTIAYTVTANKSGCTASDQVNITVSITPTAIASTTTSTLCAGETIVLTADTVMAGSYNWTGPNGFTSNNQQATVSNASQATAGTYILTITKNGCSATDSVSVTVNPSPTAQATSSSATYCKGQTANLQASGGGQYNWTGPNNFTSSTQNPDIPNFGQAGEGWYVVTVTNSSGCKDEDSVQLSIGNGNASGINVTATSDSTCLGGNVTLTVSGANSYSWTGPNGYNGSGSTVKLDNIENNQFGIYYVEGMDGNGCMSKDSIAVLLAPNGKCLDITGLITPNGDGKNDKWIISGIGNQSDVEVNIFNRWGNLVFAASPYKNNWKGQVNKGLDVGKGLLPSGTYFYVIKFNNGKDKDINGYIELQY